ncbi:MAG: hypothetical protein J5840_06180 [Lachnospiraceae bacterium]|nr:hypothetical protein [Lachnospiraceae bacterium]
MTFLSKYTKYYAFISFALLVLLLIPLCVLGFYNHPLGDDFYYGQHAAKAIRESGNVLSAIPEAAKGTVNQYNRWQGTFFAIFLMYLPPHLFGEFFYKIYPTVLILFFSASVFYLLYPLVYKGDKDSKYAWISLSSTFMIVATQQVPACGETFYWYNGSMYYTGFLALTFFFFGILLRYLKNKKNILLVPLVIIAIMLAGGNYASLLPAILTTAVLLIGQIVKKDKKAIITFSTVLVLMIIFLSVSILAPGNSARQATAAGTSAVKAVAKSVLQCVHYSLYWNGFFSFAALMLITPILVLICPKTDKIRLPFIKIVLIFLIFSSSETATFYGQNNGGPARLFDICFYMMLMALGLIWFITIKKVYDLAEKDVKKRKKEKFIPSLLLYSEIFLVLLFVLLLPLRSLSESNKVPNSAVALKTIVNGDASYYASQYNDRINAIKNDPKGDLVFAPYDVPEDLVYFLYLGDLNTDASSDSNRAFSVFYDLNSVKISD